MDPLLVELLAMAKVGGAALTPFVIVAWWLERGERIDSQKQNSVLIKEIVVAMQETRTALQTFGSILTSPRSKAR